MEGRRIFVPHELKTIEIDVEKKIFRVNGEDFGKDCGEFSISGQAGNYNEWFKVYMRVHSAVKFANYGINGEKTGEGQYQSEKIKKA